MNLPQLAEDSLQRLGERMTLAFEAERHTNAQVLERAGRMQSALGELGAGPGDHVAMFMVNHPLVHSVFQAIWRRGAVAVPVMFQLTAAELRYVLADTKAKGVVADSAVLYKVREAVKGLDHVKWILVRGGKDAPEATPPEYSLEGLLARDPATGFANSAEDDVAIVMYTSGTTGAPKGAMMTHGNMVASAEAAAAGAENHLWEGPRAGITAMPMAHMAGVAVMTAGFMTPARLAGSYSVQMAWFNPEGFMKLIVEHKCQNMVAVPTMLALILNNPKADQYDLTCLKEVVCGAAPLPVELARRFMDRYGCRIREVYGMTENAAICTYSPISVPYRAGSAGRAYPGVEIAIADEEGRRLPPGERGEIITKSKAVMKGYLNRPDATAATIRDGWLHTGDIGYLDDEGWLYVVDRKKDMIIRGGENIYPAELEDALYKHPAVAEAAVVGLPDPVMGEEVAAYVVLRPKAEATEQEILDFLAQSLTRFKLPSRIHFLESLPKSGVGKVLRRVLRDQALAAPQGK